MPITRRYFSTMVVLQITDNNKRKSCEQDDASTSSTITVDGRSFTTKQEESTTDYDATIRRRNVRFCMATNESFSNNVMCKEDLKELWYKNSEFKHFRNFTMHVAKEITKVEARSKAPLSYERVMARTYRSCCKATSEQGNVLTADEFNHLVRWAEVAVATSRLGLEKWCIRSIAHDRSYRRSLMMEMVSEAQNTYQDDFVSMDDYVAASCAAISRPMRLFSRTLAQAQAVAAHSDRSRS
jgi:hypothetical protein